MRVDQSGYVSAGAQLNCILTLERFRKRLPHRLLETWQVPSTFDFHA
jgi:hypothetical protein